MPELQISASEVADVAPVLLDLDPEEAVKQVEVWSRPEVTLAHHDKVGAVQDDVGHHVVKLTPVEEEQTMHEVVQQEA